MPMTNNGLSKLVEECGELQQVAGKMLQYPQLQFDVKVMIDTGGQGGFAKHPDGTNLRKRMEEEMGDALAAMAFVAEQLNLSKSSIDIQAATKLALFREWSEEL